MCVVILVVASTASWRNMLRVALNEEKKLNDDETMMKMMTMVMNEHSANQSGSMKPAFGSNRPGVGK